MNVIGLDFGSHHASIALWNEEKDRIEVIADDLGSRTIPTIVAYRGDEILTGQAALSQQHKNSNNTYEDIRSTYILNNDTDANSTINVEALDNKEIKLSDLSQHFFRNIHNQVKMQVGNVVRETVICLPSSMSMNEDAKKKLIDVAQQGGIRVKAVIDDSTAICLAYGLDQSETCNYGKVIVIDMGWSKTEVSAFEIKGGVLFPCGSTTINTISGNIIVDLVVKHCCKDFKRKTKMDCSESNRSLVRLTRECEALVKALSTGTEATITIDSLYEGCDYSGKISRARFDDLCAIPFMQFKNSLTSFLESINTSSGNGWSNTDITHVLLGGGMTSIPKSQSFLKSFFSTADFPKPGKGQANSISTTAEAQAVGAALHARIICLEGLLDKFVKIPDAEEMSCLPVGLNICSEGSGDNGEQSAVLVSEGTPLPTSIYMTVGTDESSCYFKLTDTNDNNLADIVFNSSGGDCKINVSISESCDIHLEVVHTSDKDGSNPLAIVDIPAV